MCNEKSTMKWVSVWAAVTIVLVLLSQSVLAIAPSTASYQGVLTRNNGMPLDTVVNITFGLFSDSVGGRATWVETHSGVLVTSGVFSAKLGQTVPLSPDRFRNSEMWLGVRVGSDSEMTPRTKLGSVPYAYRAATVDSASGGTITGDVSIAGKTTIGFDNDNSGIAAFVAGRRNVAAADYTTIPGGDSNYALGSYSNVSGGYRNIAAADYSNVGGGKLNTAGQYYARSDGLRDVGEGDYSTVGGGLNNTASGDYSVVSGGHANQATGAYSVIAGGNYNWAVGDSSTIGGGMYNQVGNSATICGGSNNNANGTSAVIAGGFGNTADSAFAIIPGGYECWAGSFSFAAGRRAKAYMDGCFRWADSNDLDFSAPDTANSFSVRASGGVYFFTDSSLTAGVRMFQGSSTWYSVSDSTTKQNIRGVDTKGVLDKVMQLPIKQWSYKTQDPSIEHIGPMAQDFWNTFHVGDDSLRISTIDPDGIALAAIQELAKRNEELETKNVKLEEEMAWLRAQVQTLMAGETKTLKEGN